MKIERIEIASFGKLKNFSMDFCDGLNLVFGNNEDGKTTVMAFLRMAFYGAKVGYVGKNARINYADRDGNKTGGSVVFSNDGHTYRLSRVFGKTPSGDKVTLFDVTLGENVVLSASGDVGENFFGMTAGAFERSIFISDRSANSDGVGVAELGEKLVSGNVSDNGLDNYDVVYKRLNDAAKKLHNNTRTATADSTEKNIERLEQECFEALEFERTATEKRRKSEQNNAEITALENDITALKAELSAAELMDKKAVLCAEKENRLKRKETEDKLCGRTEEDLKEAEGLIRSRDVLAAANEEKKKTTDSFAPKDNLQNEFETAKANLEKAKAEEEKIKAEAGNKKSKGPYLPLSVVFAVIFAVGVVLKFLFLSIPAFVIAAVFLILHFRKASALKEARLADLLRLSKAENNRTDAEREYIAVCERIKLYNNRFEESVARNDAKKTEIDITEKEIAETNERIQKILSVFGDREAEAVSLFRDLLRQRLVLSERSVSSGFFDVSDDELEKQFALLDTGTTNKSSEQIKSELSETAEKINALRIENERLNTELSMSKGRNVSVIEREIAEQKEKLHFQNAHYEALIKAIEVLTQAGERVRSSFAPALNKRTAELMRALTDGKVTDAAVSRDFSLLVSEKDEIRPFEADYLSAGCRDQAEFCLRLAVAEQTGGELCLPLLLDDVFMQYDDGRTQRGMEFLKEYSRRNQVIFFTCHNSVKDMAKSAGAIVVSLG